jgi:hypothetical protein
MRSRQRELGERVVIESRRIPRARVVAGLAGTREASLSVRRIIRLIEVRHVAAHATCRRQRELAARMAGVAIQRRVRAYQREAGELHMVELRAHPVIHGVALLALDWHPQRDVVDTGGAGVNEIFLVARVASGREPLELSSRRALVARVAVHCGVCPDQWKTIHVLVDLLDRNIPAFHCVALFAVRTHLCLVNVRVALAALRSDIREDGLGMALRAGHAFVHPAQWIFCGVVIELGNSANWFPAA